MSAGNFLGVILSDEVAVATEESKGPYLCKKIMPAYE
jgi:hypothetical protein